MPFSATRRTRFARLLTALLALAMAAPALAQSKGDKWVATWATALVSRPLPGPRAGGPGPGGPPVAPAIVVPPSGAAAPAPAAPPAPAASSRGSTRWPRRWRRWPRLRAARDGDQPDAPPDRAHEHRRLEAARGAEQRLRHGAGADRRRQRRAARQGGVDSAGVAEDAALRRRPHGNHSGGRHARERPGGPDAGAAVGRRDRPLRARRPRREPVAGHHPQRRVADELRVGHGQPRG